MVYCGHFLFLMNGMFTSERNNKLRRMVNVIGHNLGHHKYIKLLFMQNITLSSFSNFGMSLRYCNEFVMG